MKGLPDPIIYEQELQYWPYFISWNKVLNYIVENTPKDGSLVDLMCGPGYLLGQIAKKRPDLKLKGIDIDSRYIPFAKEKYPKIDFELRDILTIFPTKQFDVVICTGSLHHILFEKQEEAVKKMAGLVKPNGIVIISDSCIDDYSNEIERKAAAAKLGYGYLKQTIQNGAPEKVVEATIEILWNDVLMKEFKTSIKKREEMLKIIFGTVETLKTWPDSETEYGDYISICQRPKKV